MRSYRDSVAYQILVDEGRVAEARRLVLALGAERLGAPDGATLQAVESIAALDRLERIVRRSFVAASWQELLAVD